MHDSLVNKVRSGRFRFVVWIAQPGHRSRVQNLEHVRVQTTARMRDLLQQHVQRGAHWSLSLSLAMVSGTYPAQNIQLSVNRFKCSTIESNLRTNSRGWDCSAAELCGLHCGHLASPAARLAGRINLLRSSTRRSFGKQDALFGLERPQLQQRELRQKALVTPGKVVRKLGARALHHQLRLVPRRNRVRGGVINPMQQVHRFCGKCSSPRSN